MNNNKWLIRIALRYVNVEKALGDLAKGMGSFHGYEQGSPQDTRENVSELIPTFEDLDSFKDSYLAEQVLQEGVAKVLGVALPLPVKFALEAYSFYQYFDED